MSTEINAHRKALIKKAVKEDPAYKTNMKMKPGYLFIMVALVNGQAVYRFNFKTTKSNPLQVERLLNENDAFVVTDYKSGLITEDPNQPATGIFQSAPSQFNFPAQAGYLNPVDLEAFFHPSAALSLKVDDRTYFEGMSLWPNRVVGTDQATEQRSAAGLVPMEPYVILDGSKKSDLLANIVTYTGSKVQYSDVSGAPSPTTKRVYLALYLDGYLVNNGSNLGGLSMGDTM